MAAFQLSLGRQEDPPPIAALEFDDDTVDLGRELFIESPSRGGTNSCDGCHTNGGTINIALDTGVAKLPNVPACQLAVGKGVPGDGGFGPLPVTTMTHQQLCKKGTKKTAIVFRGDGKFDIPPVIEAADTPPFFHNNSAATIEDAVAFYTSDTFHSSPSGSGAFGGGAFVLSKDQINQIAAFLRALNALENIRSSNAYDRRAINPAELAPRKLLVELAIAETSDAIEVLTKGPVRLFASTLAVQLLQEARKLERQALKQNPPNTDLLDLAIARKGEARAEMLEDPAP
jgi:hypothetical protein